MKAPFGATAGFQVAGTLLLLSLTLTASKVTSDRQPWALLSRSRPWKCGWGTSPELTILRCRRVFSRN